MPSTAPAKFSKVRGNFQTLLVEKDSAHFLPRPLDTIQSVLPSSDILTIYVNIGVREDSAVFAGMYIGARDLV